MASLGAPLSEAEKFTKRIHNCVLSSVLMHRSLTVLEMEQAWFQDYEPMFLSEALVKAGYPDLIRFIQRYPDDVRVESSSYSGYRLEVGPRPPALISSNIALIRSTQAPKKPNPYNGDTGILGWRNQYRYKMAAEKLAKFAASCPQSVPGNPLSSTLSSAAPTRAVPNVAYQSQGPHTLNSTVPSVSGAAGNYGRSTGSVPPQINTYAAPSTGKLPLWYEDDGSASLLPPLGRPTAFIPRSVQTHPMTNAQFLRDDTKLDHAMEKLSVQSTGFRRSVHHLAPPPVTDDENESEDGFAVSVRPVRQLEMSGVTSVAPSVVKPSTLSTTTSSMVTHVDGSLSDAGLSKLDSLHAERHSFSQTMGSGLSPMYLARVRAYRQLREEGKSTTVQ